MALYLIETPSGQHRIVDGTGKGSEFLLESPWKYPTTATFDLSTVTLHTLPPDDLTATYANGTPGATMAAGVTILRTQ